MSPTSVPPFEIATGPIVQAFANGTIDAFNDPVMSIIIAGLVVSAVIGLIVAGISKATRS